MTKMGRRQRCTKTGEQERADWIMDDVRIMACNQTNRPNNWALLHLKWKREDENDEDMGEN